MDSEPLTATKKLKDDGISKMNSKLRPILAKELTQLPLLEKSFIGVLKNKRNISKAITCLVKCLPCPQFLKRCADMKLYIAPIHSMDGSVENLKKLLVEKNFDLSWLEDEFEIVEIPCEVPRTKDQMIYAQKFWPVNFHPDLNLEAIISGSIFDEVQQESLEMCMKSLIQAAELSAVGTTECNGSALIIDPDQGSILSIAASSIDQHPMWHASMLAVDLVARLQGGGAWQLFKDDVSQIPSNGTMKRKCPGVTPLRYPEILHKLRLPETGSLHPMNKNSKKSDKKLKQSEDKSGPYLCTNYWAVLLQEPCPLCAMALLHSRVSRIFYGTSNPRTGILGSKAVLHSVPGLNHRYQVWSSLLEEECAQILQKCRVVDT
ncbi:hypothetical protein QAD02_019703 [Eretmocerus hayati]|uniref:Uncharacterized protein n=1 Tax=Eretmocerus hayati TaxID=131215 RepID=A0ACC2PLI9_9HYME|nr:hypothetical protein QAD02_019703 [Eretmocerus hayati]